MTIYQTSLLEHLPVTASWFVDNPNIQKGFYENSHSTTLHKYDRDEIKTNQDFLNQTDAEPFIQSIKQAAKQFLNGPGRPFVTGIWLNEMRSDQYHYKHKHLGCYYAGCYYVEIPNGASGLEFYDGVDQTVDPVAGDLLLWRGTIAHGVPASTFSGVRRSIAFNIVIAPELEI